MDRNDRLIRAVQLATRKLASTGKFDDLMREVLVICVQAVGATAGTIYLHDPESRRLRFQHVLPEEVRDRLPMKDVPEDFGVVGQAFQSRQTISKEYPNKPESERTAFENATGVTVRSIIATPLIMEDEAPIGVVQLLNKGKGCFDETDIAVLDTVAAVASMAYSNFQLAEQMTRASSLLGMGKVSHDIGNLAAALHANLSFSSLALKGLKDHLKRSNPDDVVRMYLDSLDPMVEDLQSSVDRIVGYSHLISDISAGRPLRPEMKLAPMAGTIHDSAAYLERDGQKNRVGLRYEIDETAPPTMHDELYVFRIVQNLVGNAIRAVKETIPDDWRLLDEDDDEDPSVYGVVVVRYRFEHDTHIIEVTDTGPGIPRDVAQRILSGNARSKWGKTEGSGWGTKIVLELTATHDGKVELDSTLGVGSTFRVCFPHKPS